MRRVFYLLLFILNLLLLPIGLLGLLSWLAMPMTMAFLIHFTVENRTHDTIHITPIGAVGPAGIRSGLPIYFSRFLPFWSPWRADFPIEPGESRTLVYDYDDIQFSEIVVRDSSGILRQFVVNADPTKDQYRPPITRHFIIDNPISALPPPPPPVVTAFNAARRPVYATLVLPIAPLPLLTLTWTYRRWKKPRQIPPPGIANPPSNPAKP